MGCVYGMSFTGDGEALALGGGAVASFGAGTTMADLAASAATASWRISLFDPATARPLGRATAGKEGVVARIAPSPDGRYVANVLTDGGQLTEVLGRKPTQRRLVVMDREQPQPLSKLVLPSTWEWTDSVLALSPARSCLPPAARINDH